MFVIIHKVYRNVLNKSVGKLTYFSRVNNLATVLLGLKSINQRLAQEEIILKSWFNMLSRLAKLDEVNANEVSSAKSLVILKRFSTISFKHTRKNRGPRTEPYGAPAVVCFVVDMDDPIKTFVFYLPSNFQSSLITLRLYHFVST